MQLTIVGFTEKSRCDNCEKEVDTFHVRCEAGTIDADLCPKCLARQCRMRAKVKGDSTESSVRTSGGAT